MPVASAEPFRETELDPSGCLDRRDFGGGAVSGVHDPPAPARGGAMRGGLFGVLFGRVPGGVGATVLARGGVCGPGQGDWMPSPEHHLHQAAVLCAADVAVRATAVRSGILPVPGAGAGWGRAVPLVLAGGPVGGGGGVRVVGAVGGDVHGGAGRDLRAGGGDGGVLDAAVG